MKIGFYGHSAASWAEFPINGVSSFIDIIVEKYKADLVNIGAPQGSEERILFELKKTKKLDLAVIFHGHAGYLFLPSCERDIEVNDSGLRKAEQLWKDKEVDPGAMQAAKDDYFSYGGIKEVFGDIETFVSTMALNRQYLYHPDLQLNRFVGALSQIDQYVTAMNIPTIHIYWEQVIPSWFKFSSGLTAPEIAKLTIDLYESGLPNNISIEGQQVVAEAIIGYIETILNNE